MEQRPLRLGDNVDDYCPRERRITNHVIVVIVEGAIRQTRCSTCDAEHVYKEGREPRRRKNTDAPAVVPPRPAVSAAASGPPPPSPGDAPAGADSAAFSAAPDGVPPGNGAEAPHEHRHADNRDDTWPAHRQLIRATLPRTEGEPPPPRPIPEFTMHQRPSSFRGHGQQRRAPWGGNGVNGNTADQNRGGFRGRDHGHGGPPAHGGKPGRRRGKGKRSH